MRALLQYMAGYGKRMGEGARRFVAVLAAAAVIAVPTVSATNRGLEIDSQTIAELTDTLQRILDNKEMYHQAHEQSIEVLKKTLKNGQHTRREEYDVNLSLYEKYKKFQLDSAIVYSKRNMELGRSMNDMDLLLKANLQLVYLYSLSNRFLEAKTILDSVGSKNLNRDLLLDYYRMSAHFYDCYAVATSQSSNYILSNRYTDSTMRFLDPASFEYRLNKARKLIYGPDTVTDFSSLNELLASSPPGSLEEAYVCGNYAHLFFRQGNEDLYRYMLQRSAIADIKSATRENESIRFLAISEYERGNYNLAFKYGQSAIEDAAVGGFNMHAIRGYKLNTLISAAYSNEQQRTQSLMKRHLMIALIFLVIFAGLLAYVVWQKRKISDIRRLLEKSNRELIHFNEQLNANNAELSESNKVKEFYIVEFFEMCFNYINEMERLQASVKKMEKTRNYNELGKLISSISVNREYNAMYQHFDNVFLNLYPSFIAEVNELLRPEERIAETKSLNRELRVYALMRLGFRDTNQIAKFLCCAVTTIYCYRTRMRNKAIDRATFEDKILNISPETGT